MNPLFKLENLIRKSVAELSPYSSARDEYTSDGKEMVFLDANENPFDNSVNRYPDPQQKQLKEVLAKQKNVESKQILLGNGSDEVLDLIFRAFCNPGRDNIITLPPTYGMYKVLARTNDIEEREVLLTNDFQPDLQKIYQQIDKNTKLIFLCSPNNPTGNTFQKDLVSELLENFSGLVVIDEAYIDFSDKASWVGKLQQYPNLIITQTLSKAYGMAGIRLGIGYASSEVIQVLNKIKPPYNVNILTQEKALEGLLQEEKIKQQIRSLLEQREFLSEELKKLSFIQKVYPTDANFILAVVDNSRSRYAQLLSKGFVVRDRSSQPLCDNTLRLTVGTESENEKLLQVLREMDKE